MGKNLPPSPSTVPSPLPRSCWLVKTEPGELSIDDMKHDVDQRKTTPWDGVRNTRARNFLMQMSLGDDVVIYHSSISPPGVAGFATIARTHYPDDTCLNPASPYVDKKAIAKGGKHNWKMVDLAFARKADVFVTLDTLRATPAMKDALLLKCARLSVMPLTAVQFAGIRKLAVKLS